MSYIKNLTQLILDRIPLTASFIKYMWRQDQIHRYAPDTLSSTGLTVSLSDLAYGPLVIDKNPTPLQGSQSIYKNDLAAAGSELFQSSGTTTASYGWSVTKGVSFTIAGSLNASTPLGGGGLSVSLTVSTSTTETQSVSKTQSWSWSATVPVPANTWVLAQVYINTLSLSAPFSAKAQYAGIASLTLHIPSGFGNLTLPFDYPIGKLFAEFPEQGITVVDEKNIYLNISGTFSCVEGLGYEVRASPIPKDTPFNTFELELRERHSKLAIYTPNVDTPVMGPADGTMYHVVGVKTRNETGTFLRF